MYLKYGNYQHDAGECTLRGIMSESLSSDNGQVYAIRERWDVEGRLQIDDQGTAAANQAAMTVVIDALKAAYDVNGKDIGFYDDADNLTSHFIKSSATRSGVRVVQPPSFPDGRGAEYSTFRTYTLAVEAEHAPSGGASLVSWTETISFQGTGGPLWGYLVPINGPPQQQMFSQTSTQWAYQRGRAVMRDKYSPALSPRWPTQEHQDMRDIQFEVPADNSGRRVTTWSYVFEAPTGLAGLPAEKSIN